ncbi:MAG: GTP-binding protein [Chloroflexaceae bacterium]
MPETEEYGIRSFVYRARRPFHPARLREVVQGAALQQVLRAKGSFWLATRVLQAGQLQKTGRFLVMSAGPTWLAAIPRAEWPEGEQVGAYLARYWDERAGDCRQELVFIGVNLNEAALRSALDACLLTDGEMELGPERRAFFEDPFPAWLARP